MLLVAAPALSRFGASSAALALVVVEPNQFEPGIGPMNRLTIARTAIVTARRRRVWCRFMSLCFMVEGLVGEGFASVMWPRSATVVSDQPMCDEPGPRRQFVYVVKPESSRRELQV